MAGRKPKPTKLKELAGNPGKRALNKLEPKYSSPDELRVPRGKLSDEGQRLWRVLAPQLAQAGVLTAADLPALEMLCNHYAIARMALEVINAPALLQLGAVDEDGNDVEGVGVLVENGILSTTKDGTLKKHPAVSVFMENSRAFRMYLAEFGLTPSSRTKITTQEGTSEQSLADLLFGGAGGGFDDE